MPDYRDAIAQEKIRQLISESKDPNLSNDPDIIEYHKRVIEVQVEDRRQKNNRERENRISRANSDYIIGCRYVQGLKRDYSYGDKERDLSEAQSEWYKEDKKISKFARGEDENSPDKIYDNQKSDSVDIDWTFIGSLILLVVLLGPLILLLFSFNGQNVLYTIGIYIGYAILYPILAGIISLFR
jgi:hypothetical protein